MRFRIRNRLNCEENTSFNTRIGNHHKYYWKPWSSIQILQRFCHLFRNILHNKNAMLDFIYNNIKHYTVILCWESLAINSTITMRMYILKPSVTKRNLYCLSFIFVNLQGLYQNSNLSFSQFIVRLPLSRMFSRDICLILY